MVSFLISVMGEVAVLLFSWKRVPKIHPIVSFWFAVPSMKTKMRELCGFVTCGGPVLRSERHTYSKMGLESILKHNTQTEKPGCLAGRLFGGSKRTHIYIYIHIAQHKQFQSDVTNEELWNPHANIFLHVTTDSDQGTTVLTTLTIARPCLLIY